MEMAIVAILLPKQQEGSFHEVVPRYWCHYFRYLLAGLFAGYSSKGPDAPAASSDPKEVEGEITVITQRTDIVDTVFQDYAKEFNKLYPNVKVILTCLPCRDCIIRSTCLRFGGSVWGLLHYRRTFWAASQLAWVGVVLFHVGKQC